MPVTNWSQRQKTDIKAVPTEKKAPSTDRGTRYEATVTKVEAKSFSTGTIGFNVKFNVQGLEKPVYTNYFTRIMDKTTGDLRDNSEKGKAMTSKFYAACGLTSEQQLAFPALRTPKDEKAVAALAALEGSKVALYLVDAEFEGRPKKEVRAVFPLDKD